MSMDLELDNLVCLEIEIVTLYRQASSQLK